ncbi:E3 SUMO-protein ligase ZBED1-like [Diretmus argenteus]
MSKALNAKYSPPSRSYLSDTLIPTWFGVEKANVIAELKDVPKLAITSDGWTSLSQDHYLTVTVQYTSQGSLKQKVLHTRAVYQSQTGEVVAEEISDILGDFEIELSKIVAVTVDNAGNMDVAIKKLNILKIGCFAHTLNLAAQKVFKIPSVDKWAAQIRAVIVWFKRSSMANIVLKEKQDLIFTKPNQPTVPDPQKKHTLILDVKTRWNSFYLMMERFMEQYPAIQAAALDPRVRKPMTNDNLVHLKDEDFHKAEEFVDIMKILYTSTLCVSSDKSATAGQIIPILQKLEEHFTVKHDDTTFATAIKEKVWGNLSERYQDANIQAFLHEATAMDPRFKGRPVSDATWDRLRKATVEANHVTGAATPPGLSEPEQRDTEQQQHEEEEEEGEGEGGEEMEETYKPSSALEELFSEEDRKLRRTIQLNTLSISERIDVEIELYKGLSPIPMKEDPVMWWWEKRATLPFLAQNATSYLCAQASSTPSETL